MRQAVHEGDVLEALELARKLDSVTMEERPELTFRLKLEHLVRLILVDKVEESIAFSQEHLAPIAETDPKALEALENAMTLLAFPDAELLRGRLPWVRRSGWKTTKSDCTPSQTN